MAEGLSIAATARTAVDDTGGAPAALDLSPSCLHGRFAELRKARPALYWPDMIGSAAIGWASLAVALTYQSTLLVMLPASLLAMLSLYRAVLFIHELTHLKRRALPGFGVAWNTLVGVPLQVPSLMYVGSHGDHHRRSVFGTNADPEYEPIAHWSRGRVVASILPILLVPPGLVLRWGLLGPLSYLSKPLRRVLVERASTLVINPAYRRHPPRGRAIKRWAAEEAACAAFAWLVVAGVVGGSIPLAWVVHWYAIEAGILVMNHLRTLASHRYMNDGDSVDLEGQLLDSVNLVSGSWVTALMAPVGLRYHALHHLLPSLPYHSLGEAHRALVAELPADSPYHATIQPGILAGLRGLLAHAGGTSSGGSGGVAPSRRRSGDTPMADRLTAA